MRYCIAELSSGEPLVSSGLYTIVTLPQNAAVRELVRQRKVGLLHNSTRVVLFATRDEELHLAFYTECQDLMRDRHGLRCRFKLEDRRDLEVMDHAVVVFVVMSEDCSCEEVFNGLPAESRASRYIPTFASFEHPHASSAGQQAITATSSVSPTRAQRMAYKPYAKAGTNYGRQRLLDQKWMKVKTDMLKSQ